MKIKREIKIGDFTTEIEIELTKSEMYDIALNVQHEDDIFDVSLVLDNLLGLEREDHDILETFRKTPDIISDIAYNKRERENEGSNYENAAYEAILDEVDSYETTYLTKVFGRLGDT